MAAGEFTSAAGESATYDEGTHLAAGYSYLVTGDYRLNPEHPVLGKILAALPLLLLDPSVPLDNPVWAQSNALGFAGFFMYANRVPAATLLMAGRSVVILFTLLFGLWIAIWTRRRFGAPTALFALTMFTFDPNFLAHGHYVTTDLFVSFFSFLAVTLWIDYLDRGARRALVGSGLAFGAAAASKYSGLFLVPVFPMIYLAVWIARRRLPIEARRTGLRDFVACMLVVALLSGAVLAVCYSPEIVATVRYLTHTGTAPLMKDALASRVDRNTIIGAFLYRVANPVHMPAYSYLVGLSDVNSASLAGRPSYLFGMYSPKGWWYYFPVVFVLKTPAATLLVLALAALLAVVWLRKRAEKQLFVLSGLAIPVIVYMGFAMSSRMDVGLRHILPIFAFLYVLAASVFWECGSAVLRRAFPFLVAGLVVLLMVESLSIAPHYLAFFNLFTGGPRQGPRYLLDSNIDWGQDLKHLGEYLDARGISNVCLSYFGTASPEYYGIHPVPWPSGLDNPETWKTMDCVAAVSVTPLYGVYVSRKRFAYLRTLQPMAKVGYSIYLYDLRKRGAP